MAVESRRRDAGARTWSLAVAVLGVAALAVARFVRYVQVVSDADVAFASTLAWWGMYLTGLGLVATGLVGYFEEEMGPRTSDWAAFLVGVLVLVIMPAAPGVDWAGMFSGVMGDLFGP